jgi:mRNA interferase RelE/StbE
VDSEKLTGYDYRRKDIGEYRIVYRFENDEIKVAITGKRNDDEVYKLLKNQS